MLPPGRPVGNVLPLVATVFLVHHALNQRRFSQRNVRESRKRTPGTLSRRLVIG